jgi:hypothetical protein
VSRLPRAENDLYSRHSQRIPRALQVGELDFYSYAVLSFLVDTIALPGRNGEAIFTLEAFSEALEWPLGTESQRQKLHELRRQRWIEFESPRRGRGASWIFRLSGAAIDGERDEVPTNFQPEPPSPLEINSNRRREVEAAKPQADSVSDPSEFPNAQTPREEKRREEIFSEGNYDHGVGKTTDADERERAFLADCQKLVDAGLARWRENDDGGAA